MNNQSNQDSII